MKKICSSSVTVVIVLNLSILSQCRLTGSKVVIGRQCFQNVQGLHAMEDTFKFSKELEESDVQSHAKETQTKCGTFVFFPQFVFLFSNRKFSASILSDSVGGNKRKRSLTNSFSTQFLRSKLFSNLPNFQNFFKTKSSGESVGNEEKEIRTIGNEIDNFKISGNMQFFTEFHSIFVSIFI